MDEVLIDGNKIKKDFQRYRKVMSCIQADIPIQVLCLPKTIENILIRSGCLRVYDMIDLDFSEIKGIGPTRRILLSSRLDQFLSVGS